MNEIESANKRLLAENAKLKVALADLVDATTKVLKAYQDVHYILDDAIATLGRVNNDGETTINIMPDFAAEFDDIIRNTIKTAGYGNIH